MMHGPVSMSQWHRFGHGCHHLFLLQKGQAKEEGNNQTVRLL